MISKIQFGSSDFLTFVLIALEVANIFRCNFHKESDNLHSITCTHYRPCFHNFCHFFNLTLRLRLPNRGRFPLGMPRCGIGASKVSDFTLLPPSEMSSDSQLFRRLRLGGLYIFFRKSLSVLVTVEGCILK